MRPWERRLADLARLLTNCAVTYYDPDLFRMNTNQFLQTARTITFIIQKNKSTVPRFDEWYQCAVVDPWRVDDVMTWAKDSRNEIEKVGDLDQRSSLEVVLIISYEEEDEIRLEVGRDELVRANVKRLLRLARKRLPSGVSDSAIVKIERRWVANNLPDWELLTALIYVYARLREACSSLAAQLDTELPSEIPEATRFDTLHTDAQATRYVKLRGHDQLGQIGAHTIERNPEYEPFPELAELMETSADEFKSRSLDGQVGAYAKFTKINFEHFGSQLPMLMIFDENWKVVDGLSTQFDDQAEKYIFWRRVADRVLYLNPQAIIWICESWIRDLRSARFGPIRNRPVIGEQLNVVGMDRDGNLSLRSWNIERDGPDDKPSLIEISPSELESKPPKLFYLEPIAQAFEQLRR